MLKNKIYVLVNDGIVEDMSNSQHYLKSKRRIKPVDEQKKCIILVHPDETNGEIPVFGNAIAVPKG
jgi:hypothetical protein